MIYHAYGLWLAVDGAISGLSALPTAPHVDVRVSLGGRDAGPGALWFESPLQDEQGRSALTIWKLTEEPVYRLRYADGAEFLVEAAGSRVWTDGEALSAADLASYFLGPVLGFVLRLRGVTCLHASAVALEGHAVAFIGPPEAGKSTTAGAFARQGYPVLADDIVALELRGDSVFAQPGYPRLRLWPDSVACLSSAPSILPPLTAPEGGSRLHLDVSGPGYQFQRESLPLAAVYFLSERRNHPSAPSIESGSPRDSLMALVANTYGSTLIDREMRAQEFAMLRRLVAAVPVRRVHAHADPAFLSRLCDVIREDSRRP